MPGLGLGVGLPFIKKTGEQPIPAPDFLFDTRTGLVITDSVAGQIVNLKDFIYFNHKSSSDALASGQSTYSGPASGDITYVCFIRPNQASVNYTDIRGIGGTTGNYIRIYHATKQVNAYLGSSIMTSITTFPDSGNYTNNLYMLVWKYVQSEGKAYFRVYNTSTNYLEKTRVAALPASAGSVLTFSQTAFNANCGIILSLYYTSNLDNTALTALFNGTIPTTNLTSFINFIHNEGLRTYAYDSKANGQFQFQDAGGESLASPYYNLRSNDIQAALPLIYGYTNRDLNIITYLPDMTKGITSKVGDIEFPNTALWNMANCRAYFDALTDTDLKAIFNKANRTYWKASIENEEHYIDIGGGYYGAWGANQLLRDFITRHAQDNHKNHIFASLRTSGSVVTGITAIRVYKTNLS